MANFFAKDFTGPRPLAKIVKLRSGSRPPTVCMRSKYNLLKAVLIVMIISRKATRFFVFPNRPGGWIPPSQDPSDPPSEPPDKPEEKKDKPKKK